MVSGTIFPNTTLGLYNKAFWENVLVEAHGMVFDILIIGVVVIWLDTRRSNFNERLNMENDLNDLSYLNLPEVNHKKIGIMYRLNQMGVEKFDINELIIIDVRIKRLSVKSSALNNLKASKSLINESQFNSTSLEFADFSQTQIKSTSFHDCEMKKVSFLKAKASGVDFSGSNLERAKFIDTNLQSAIFKGCNLREANFEGANLRSANFKEVKNLKLERILKAKNLDYIVLDESVKVELKKLKGDIKGL